MLAQTGQVCPDSSMIVLSGCSWAMRLIRLISVPMAMGIGLDSNRDGVLDENDANFARWETVGGCVLVAGSAALFAWAGRQVEHPAWIPVLVLLVAGFLGFWLWLRSHPNA